MNKMSQREVDLSLTLVISPRLQINYCIKKRRREGREGVIGGDRWGEEVCKERGLLLKYVVKLHGGKVKEIC